jgi:hypothetical protein
VAGSDSGLYWPLDRFKVGKVQSIGKRSNH